MATQSESRTLNRASASSRSAIRRGISRTATGSMMPSRSRVAGTPKMAFDERQDGLFLDHAHVDQRFAEPQAFLRAFGQGLVELLRRDNVGADEQLAERAGAVNGRDGSGGFRVVDRDRTHNKKLRMALPVSPNTSNRAPTPVTLSTSLQSAPGFASFIAPPIR